MSQAVDRIRAFPAGTRVVVRYAVEDGATDALGDLVAVTDSACTVRTRSGVVTIPFGAVLLAKAVPPPPARRPK
ncbi:ferrous iron transport protein A [Specibacter cremeus]|uniref:putative acetyltransferase n=1 Tax=Specibacter cremeus TaxID=1629051 RepID=UPI000F7828B0|nr:ferrous iron transport protein A [Specibacter cremeus]